MISMRSEARLLRRSVALWRTLADGRTVIVAVVVVVMIVTGVFLPVVVRL